MIKSTILFNGNLQVTKQISLLSAQSASIANIEGVTYFDTDAIGSLIEIN